MSRFILALFLVFSLSNALPVDNDRKPMVVDIPADLIVDEQPPKIVPLAGEYEGDEEEKPIVIPESKEIIDEMKGEEENVELIPNKNTNIFGFKIPTVFIYRRPVFQQQPQSPFSNFFSSSPFGRPLVQQPLQPHFANVMSNMDTMMKRMQEQMSSFWGNVFNPNNPITRPLAARPQFTFGNSEESEEDKINDKDTIDLDKLPANYSNSTSETKIIDGQLVTLNKTIHKISSNNSSGFFQVSIFNYHPKENKEENAKPTPAEPIIDPETTKVQESQPTTTTSTSVIEENNSDKVEKVVPSAENVPKEAADPSFNELDGAPIENHDQPTKGIDQGLLEELLTPNKSEEVSKISTQ